MMRNRWQRRDVIAATIMIIAFASACSDYQMIAPPKDTDAVYWELKADHRAVLLSLESPHQSMQLTATPYNVQGSAIALDTLDESAQVVWESADNSTVEVSQTGLITARKIATRVNVYATLTVRDITRRDTIWVGVTQTAPSALDSLVLYVPNGKTVVPAGGTLTLAARTRLANGQLLTGVPVSYRVNNRWLADFKGTPGLLSGMVPDDSIYVYATSTVYGVTMRDSLLLYTGRPVRALAPVFTLEAQLSTNRELIYVPRIVDLPSGPGSTFSWVNNSASAPKNAIGFSGRGGIKVDIIFDHPEFSEALFPTSPSPLYNQSGNILQLTYEAPTIAAFRKFNQPGEHWYTVEPLGIRGKITIGER